MLELFALSDMSLTVDVADVVCLNVFFEKSFFIFVNEGLDEMP